METFKEKMKDFHDGSFYGTSSELSGDETAAIGLVAREFSSWDNKDPSFPSVSVPSAAQNPVEISTEEWQLWQEFLEQSKRQWPPDKDESERAVFQIPFDQIPKKKRSKRTWDRKSTPEQLSVSYVENPLQMPMEECRVGTEQLQESNKMEQRNAKACRKHNLKDQLKDEENDEKPKKQRKNRPSPNPAIEDLPASFRTCIEQMGGTNPILVVQKELNKSDIDPDQGRFLIPKKGMDPDFLTPDESHLLEIYHKNKYFEGDMRAVMIQPSLETSTVSLRVWDGKSKTHVLVKDWKLVVKRNGLKIGDTVQLWSFRIGSQLCFALPVPWSAVPHESELCRTDYR